MTAALILLGAAILYIFMTPSFAQAESLTAYDDFRSKEIDPIRWARSFTDKERSETFTQISNGELNMRLRSYGGAHADHGFQAGAVRAHLRIPDNSVTVMQADVRLNEYELSANPDNSTPTIIAARLFGRFFHDGPEDDAGGCVDDVVAAIGLSRSSRSGEPAEVLHAVAFAGKCVEEIVRDARSFCGKYSVSFAEDLGVVKVGEIARLCLEWDRVGHRFVYRLNEDDPIYHAYEESDAVEPSSPVRKLSVRATVANSSKEPIPFAYGDVCFSNFFINKTASPPAPLEESSAAPEAV